MNNYPSYVKVNMRPCERFFFQMITIGMIFLFSAFIKVGVKGYAVSLHFFLNCLFVVENTLFGISDHYERF